VKGQATIDNEVGERKLVVFFFKKKNPMKGQTTLYQDSPVKSAIDHNKIGRSSKENAIKKEKKKKRKSHKTFIESYININVALILC
jgi:hypothetical protein